MNRIDVPRTTVVGVLLFSMMVFVADVSAQKRYYRGNTHNHSYPNSPDVTDPNYTGPNIVSQYKARGYDFLVFTDHGAWWNAKVLSTPDFTVINGEEPGISGGGRWGHFTALNLRSRVSGSGLTHQQLIDAIRAQNGVPFLNHPRYDAIPITAVQVINDMKNNLNHLEIYNAPTASQPPPDDISVWDSVLTTGRLMYGIAADDSHREGHQGKAWIMVYASSNAQDTLVQAIQNGDFYATTGIVLDSVVYSREGIYVKSKDGENIRFIGKNGTVLTSVTGSGGYYQVRGDEGYVRAEITNSAGKRAWVQPLMVSGTSGYRYDPGGSGSMPYGFSLSQNYPNPFNPTTAVSYQLPVVSDVKLAVCDALGREVSLLVNEVKEPGTYTVHFDAAGLSSGVYFYRLVAGDFFETKRLVLLK